SLRCFNAATPTSAWRTQEQIAQYRKWLAWLQCGHADVGVENCVPQLANVDQRTMLQCGHADVGVENASAPRSSPMPAELQCGHADVGVENLARWRRQRESDLASMRPRRRRRGEQGEGCGK